MKSGGQVAQKLKQAKYRHFKKEASSLLSRRPNNCRNCKVLQTGSGSLGVCSLDSNVCDPTVDDRSKECEEFSLRHSKEEIKASLREFFETRGLGEIAVRFPDVAALLWVLDEAQEEDLLPGSTLVGEISGVDVWANSPSQASKAWEELQELQVLRSDAQVLRKKVKVLHEELSSKDLELQQAKAEVESLSKVSKPLPWWRRLFR